VKRLRWSLAAADDLEGIANYLHLHYPSHAVPTVQRLYGAAQRLKDFPWMGQAGKKAGTRELLFAPLPYRLIYAVGETHIHILRFLHTSRNWP
jgi:addiction module RelE/StbE family toxin